MKRVAMKRFSVVSVVGLVAALLVAVGGGSVPAAAATTGVPHIWPTPQTVQDRHDIVPVTPYAALVIGSHTDPSAVDVVKEVLTQAGVRTVQVVGDTAPRPDVGLTVYIGGPDENTASDEALHAIGIENDASGLPAEGYVLGIGKDADGQGVVVLDGVDPTGTFYAAQTLRQLLVDHPGRDVFPAVAIRDWPAMTLRGVIEGFYGTPWSDAARLDQMDFYGAHKMNVYVYSPKDDPYLRAQWRQPYPADQLAVLQTLVQRATANHVQFTYAVSPGLSVCYSSDADAQALMAKFQSLWDIGVRDFAVPLDDISYTSWNCAADQAMFGTGGGAAGAAQAYLLNKVQRGFIDTHPGAAPLEMVPTEYYDQADSPYKTAIRTQLDPDVIVEWTGPGVVVPKITSAQAAAAKAVFGHDILIWDNYPVNDYTTDRLLLGPYVGRDAGIAGSIIGITSNPMIQPYASETSVAGVADFTWNPDAYDAQASWTAELNALAGGDADVQAALRTFADLNYYSILDPRQAPELSPKIASFWTAWESGDTGAATQLEGTFKAVAQAPDVLRGSTIDPGFLADTAPWLDATKLWGQADLAALQALVDVRNGLVERGIKERQQALDLAKQAAAVVYHGLGGNVAVHVGDGVLDTFVNNAVAEIDRALGLHAQRATAMTSLSQYQANAPANMTDGDLSTFFWSNRAALPNDYVGVDLGQVREIRSVNILMSKSGSPTDYIRQGALEISTDGTQWTGVGSFSNTPEIAASLPAETMARYVRLRATGAQDTWVVVREFTVTGPGTTGPVASGGPAPAAGSSLANAVDGDLNTSYTASGSAEHAAPLVITLPAARPLDRIAILADASADVQVRSGGVWRSVGELSPGYTELPVGGDAVDAIQLVWGTTSRPPVVTEVIPWYADVDAVKLTVPSHAIDLETGATQDITVSLDATRPVSTPGVLTVGPLAGGSITPASTSLTLSRGGHVSLTLTVTAGTPGRYIVPVTFQPTSGAAVTGSLNIVVHPNVSGTNVAAASAGAVATASSTEQNLPQFTPDHAIDGDTGTRWSSEYDDASWLQVKLAAPAHLGKIVLRWEAAHASAYEIQTSTDGTTWTTAATVTGSQGGTETVWIDQADVRYLRMQGVSRASTFGYSIYEMQVYPVA